MTLVSLRLSLKENLTLCLLFSLCFTIVKLSFPASSLYVTEKSTVLPEVTSVGFTSLTEIFQPPPAPAMTFLKAFSCATLTASVSAEPAATFVICRVKF